MMSPAPPSWPCRCTNTPVPRTRCAWPGRGWASWPTCKTPTAASPTSSSMRRAPGIARGRPPTPAVPGGLRALWALATAWRLTGEAPYLGRFRQAHLAPTGDLKVQSVQALALMEVYRRRPRTALRRRILALCDAIVASGPGYFRDRPGRAQVALWGYHQLLAVARAGRLFARPDYVAACASTVRTLARPVIAEGFYHVYPGQQDQQCAYSMSPLATGLEELYRVTHRGAYRDLALRCAAWLDGANLCGRPLYDARSGRCGDGIAQGAASPNCGAESAIEAGFIEMARRRLLADDRTRRRAGASSHAS